MKPRLIKRSGLWYCRLRLAGWLAATGIGYTPLMAYRDWVKESKA